MDNKLWCNIFPDKHLYFDVIDTYNLYKECGLKEENAYIRGEMCGDGENASFCEAVRVKLEEVDDVEIIFWIFTQKLGIRLENYGISSDEYLVFLLKIMGMHEKCDWLAEHDDDGGKDKHLNLIS